MLDVVFADVPRPMWGQGATFNVIPKYVFTPFNFLAFFSVLIIEMRC